jgi:hypothetical protein
MEKEIKKPKGKNKIVKNDDSSIPPDISDLEVAKKMIKIYQSAVDRRLRFDLSFESVKKLLTYPTCYYTNKKFEEDGLFQRSFDRVDSGKGYVEGNVVACTVDINGKKSNLSFDEIECLYKKLAPSTKKKPKSIEILDVSINEDQSSADTNT